MRFILVFCLTLTVASPIHVATPTKPPSVSLDVRNAGELADACTATTSNQADFAWLKFLQRLCSGRPTNGSPKPDGMILCRTALD
jgi:hypothetical protein